MNSNTTENKGMLYMISALHLVYSNKEVSINTVKEYFEILGLDFSEELYNIILKPLNNEDFENILNSTIPSEPTATTSSDNTLKEDSVKTSKPEPETSVVDFSFDF